MWLNLSLILKLQICFVAHANLFTGSRPARSIGAYRLQIYLKAGQVLSQCQIEQQVGELVEAPESELTTPDTLSRGSENTPGDAWYFGSSCSAISERAPSIGIYY
jgi:hypothetical protein